MTEQFLSEKTKNRASSKIPHFEMDTDHPNMSQAEVSEYLSLRNALHALSTKENERLLKLYTTYHPAIVRR